MATKSAGRSAKIVGSGLPVDERGGPTVDPTRNVLDLVRASVLRLDDLRSAETRRQDAMREMETAHRDKVEALTSDFNAQLRDAEAKRIDAIRAVDVNAVAVASARAADQATVLATQVQVSADALRGLVSASAATLAAQQAAASAEFAKRLAELERSKYEGAGRSTVADPQLERLAALVEKLAGREATGVGKSAGISAVWVAALGAVSLVAGLLGIAGVLYSVLTP